MGTLTGGTGLAQPHPIKGTAIKFKLSSVYR